MDDWFHTLIFMHPEYVHNWTVFRLLFSQKYQVTAIPHTFIHKVLTITLDSCNNSLNKYMRKISEAMNGAKESFLRPEVTFPDDDEMLDPLSGLVHSI